MELMTTPGLALWMLFALGPGPKGPPKLINFHVTSTIHVRKIMVGAYYYYPQTLYFASTHSVPMTARSLFHWALGPASFAPNCKRQTGYLCICILPMRRSLFHGQLGPGALGPGPRAQLRAQPCAHETPCLLTKYSATHEGTFENMFDFAEKIRLSLPLKFHGNVCFPMKNKYF